MKTPCILLFVFLIVGCTPDRIATFGEPPVPDTRFLIITADDFGASENINEGIAIAADSGLITEISALANFTEALPQLTGLSQRHPEIGVGVHLNITTGRPILDPEMVPTLVKANGDFFSLEELLPVIQTISLNELRKELRAQIEEMADNQLKVDHLSDQNGILTFYGPFYTVLLELAVEYNLPVRSPEIAGVKFHDLFPDSKMSRYGRELAKQLVKEEPVRSMQLVKYARAHEIRRKVENLNTLGIPHPDLLVECFWGDPTTSNLSFILEHLPQGTSELILHLGTDARQGCYPSGLDLNYFNNRELELKTITEVNLSNCLKRLNIQRINFLDLPKSMKAH